MINKRLTAVAAAALILVMFSACNDGGKQENTTQTTTEASSESSEERTTEPVEEVIENRETARIANAALSSVEFPQTVEVSDKDQITDNIGINLDNVEEYCILQQMMSVHLVEVIVVKPEKDKLAEVLAELNQRKDDLLNVYAFYPNQVASAENTVVGSKGDYAYLICHEEADKAEDALRAVIEG